MAMLAMPHWLLCHNATCAILHMPPIQRTNHKESPPVPTKPKAKLLPQVTRVIVDSRNGDLDVWITTTTAQDLCTRGVLWWDLTNASYCTPEQGKISSEVRQYIVFRGYGKPKAAP